MTHDLRLTTQKNRAQGQQEKHRESSPKTPSFTRRSLGEGGKPAPIEPPIFHQTKMRNYNLKNMLQFSYFTLSAHHHNLTYNPRLTTYDLRLTTQKNREHVQQGKHRESSPKSTLFHPPKPWRRRETLAHSTSLFLPNKDAKL